MKLLFFSALVLSFLSAPTIVGAQENEAREEFRAGIAAVRADDWEVARGAL